MRRGRNGVVENKRAENEEPGDAEAIPQVGMIDDQKKYNGKNESSRLGRNEEDRGYGHQQERGKRKSYRSMRRQDSGNTIFDQNGTPLAERNNPLEEWRSPQAPLDDGEGDLGEQNTDRLSDVEEHPSQLTPYVTTQSDELPNNEDGDELDLEGGDKLQDDWSLSSEEAERYIQEEKDNSNRWASIRAKFREPLAECLAVSCLPRIILHI
jgi:aquaglyceroporin related protein